MSCCFDKEIIQKYADNTIDPLEFIFLKEHMNYCGECRRELDLVMTLENQLSKFFDDDSEVKELDLLITKLVYDCMDEVEKNKKFKYAINRGIELGSRIVDNSTRFVEYIPGSKRMGKGVKKTASATVDLLKALVKKEVGKLLASVL
ncbi:MAG: anti-sigma factor family protein [Clostridia bacterium]